MSGYLSGLSSPSVTDETITRASSPILNSAGHTRLTRLTTWTSNSSRFARAIALSAAGASSTTLTLVRCMSLLHLLDLQVALDLRHLRDDGGDHRADHAEHQQQLERRRNPYVAH